jgi:hypothetical protein
VATSALLSILVQETADHNSNFKTKLAGFDVLLRAWEKKHAEVGTPITAQQAQRRQELSSRLQAGQVLPTRNSWNFKEFSPRSSLTRNKPTRIWLL